MVFVFIDLQFGAGPIILYCALVAGEGAGMLWVRQYWAQKDQLQVAASAAQESYDIPMNQLQMGTVDCQPEVLWEADMRASGLKYLCHMDANSKPPKRDLTVNSPLILTASKEAPNPDNARSTRAGVEAPASPTTRRFPLLQTLKDSSVVVETTNVLANTTTDYRGTATSANKKANGDEMSAVGSQERASNAQFVTKDQRPSRIKYWP